MDSESETGPHLLSALYQNIVLLFVAPEFLLWQSPFSLSPDINWGLMGISLFSLFLLLISSALVSGSEVAYFSLNPEQLEQLDRESTRSGERILHLLKGPQQLLATILIINNIVNIAIILISYFLVKHIFAVMSPLAEILITTVAITFIIVLFGEVMPKVYANYHNLSLARFVSAPLSFLYRFFLPFSTLLSKTSNTLEAKLQQIQNKNVSREEVERAIDLVVVDEKVMETTNQAQILKGLLDFKEIAVKQVMCNRMDMFALEEITSFKELQELVLKENKYSRIPVYKEDLDEIIGILYVKDLLPFINLESGKIDNFDWRDLIKKDIVFVHENKKIDRLLKEFQQKRQHIAIVVDEYGGTSGLITLEDILEVIVGEIQDEHQIDAKDEEFIIDKNKYRFDGRTRLIDVYRIMNIDPHTFEEEKGEADSLGGLILEILERFPEEKETIPVGEHFLFVIESIEETRIKSVIIIDQRKGGKVRKMAS